MRALEAVTYIPLMRWEYLYRLAQMGILEEEDWRSEVVSDAGYYFSTPYGRAWWQVDAQSMAASGEIPGEVYELVSSIIDNPGHVPPQEDYGHIMEVVKSNILTENEILTGDWEIHASVGGRVPITVNCAMTQTGNTLGGSCIPVMENPEASEMSGTVSGTTATWGYNVVFNGEPGTVAFEASTITADGMLGTINLSGTEAPFSAIRR